MSGDWHSYRDRSLGRINTEDFGKLKEDFSNLKSDFGKQKDEMNYLRRELEKSKFDLITLLGVFVGLITYLGLEIQVFKTINDPLLIIGVSIFFISSILLFILCIHNIVNKTSCLEWKDFKNPLNIILVFLLAMSVFFIIIGYSMHNGIEVRHRMASKCDTQTKKSSVLPFESTAR